MGSANSLGPKMFHSNLKTQWSRDLQKYFDNHICKNLPLKVQIKRDRTKNAETFDWGIIEFSHPHLNVRLI